LKASKYINSTGSFDFERSEIKVLAKGKVLTEDKVLAKGKVLILLIVIFQKYVPHTAALNLL